jgi:hypothetical protein
MPDWSHATHRERFVARTVLVVGLIVSIPSMGVGLLLSLLAGEGPGGPLDSWSPDTSNGAEMLTMIGIGALAATPAINVVALFIVWLRQRQLRLAGVAFIVALTLAVAVVVGEG